MTAPHKPCAPQAEGRKCAELRAEPSEAEVEGEKEKEEEEEEEEEEGEGEEEEELRLQLERSPPSGRSRGGSARR